jgi:hypothetical protein
MFRLVYSHLQVNSRHKFQASACRLQQGIGQVFLLKLNTRLIISRSGKNEIKLVVIIALRFCPIFMSLLTHVVRHRPGT